MKKTICLIALLVLSFAAAYAQTAPAQRPDPEIQKMLREISAKNVEASIRKLVSFGTRNTLSEQDNPTRDAADV